LGVSGSVLQLTPLFDGSTLLSALAVGGAVGVTAAARDRRVARRRTATRPAPASVPAGHGGGPGATGAAGLPDGSEVWAVRFLLDMADPDFVPQIRDRLRLPPSASGDAAEAATVMGGAARDDAWSHAWRLFEDRRVPVSVLTWALEADRPDTNDAICRTSRLPEAVRRDIMLGVPYGSDAGDWVSEGIVAVSPGLPKRLDMTGVRYRDMTEGPGAVAGSGEGDERGIIAALRWYGAARKMVRVRHITNAVGRRDWAAIGAADLAEPLPGYARWALSTHVACPAPLRAQFGSDQPYFAKRMRRAGIVGDSGTYAASWTPARSVLSMLDIGVWAFPARLEQARELLRPLVRDELGRNVEAWAVLVQLLPGFTGTLPELITTSGAIALGAG
jgi:hypothetical protein